MDPACVSVTVHTQQRNGVLIPAACLTPLTQARLSFFLC